MNERLPRGPESALPYPNGIGASEPEQLLPSSITTERRGSNGFGYDPVFEVGDRTFAEMETREKNEISHRAKALRALADALQR